MDLLISMKDMAATEASLQLPFILGAMQSGSTLQLPFLTTAVANLVFLSNLDILWQC